SYERLLLLSFWVVCQGKSRAQGHQKVNMDDSKLRFKLRKQSCKNGKHSKAMLGFSPATLSRKPA
ncbi:MAG: hypothetical protein WB755_06660, partial [Terriglobales bacterium]